MKVAIIYDWLTNMGGAEHLLLTIHKAYPDAPIFTSVFDSEKCPAFKDLDIRTTYLQHLPRFIRHKHQLFPVLRAHAFRTLDLTEYDVIISSASAEAKAVRARPDAVHICYCHTPTRYYWSHYEQYKKEPGFGALNPLIKPLIPPFVAWMRKLDLKAVSGVDYFLANSIETAKRVETYYKRPADVLNPAVDLQPYRHLDITQPRKGFIILGRQVSYKRFDLAVETCTKLGLPLTVVGDGPEHQKLQKIAGQTVQFISATDEEKVQLLATAKAFLFPQLEDFGMVLVEAMAAGTPVIAFGKGGALDVITEGKSGLFFNEQTVESFTQALQRFQSTTLASPQEIQACAEKFSEEEFIKKLHAFVDQKVAAGPTRQSRS